MPLKGFDALFYRSDILCDKSVNVKRKVEAIFCFIVCRLQFDAVRVKTVRFDALAVCTQVLPAAGEGQECLHHSARAAQVGA